jgi:flagellar biosynthesis/type III secretory pathway chaperone
MHGESLNPTTATAGAPDARPPIERLCAHLDAEVAALEALDALLRDEASALRRMDADGVLAITDQKVRLLERHQLLAAERMAVLQAVAPEARTVGQARAQVDAAGSAALAERQERLRALTAAIGDQQRLNTVFARAARELVQGRLKVVERAHAGARTVYGADARIQTGVPRRGVDRRG